MSKNGRPTKLTPEVAKKITWALRLGNFRKTAAAYAGVSERTLTEWLSRGSREESGLYADFYAEVMEAEQAAEVRALGAIHQAMQRGDWKAAAWFLERKHPDRYCVKSAVLLGHRLKIEGDVALQDLSDEELQAKLLEGIEGVAPTLPKDALRAVLGLEPEGDDEDYGDSGEEEADEPKRIG